MGKILTLVSLRGGTGRSSLTASLAVQMAAAGQSVLAVDLDLGRRSLDLILGRADRVVYDISDISRGRMRSRQVILTGEGNCPHLLPASQTLDPGHLDLDRLREMMGQLADRYDRVLVDTPAGWSQVTEMAVQSAHQVLILETPDNAGIRGCDRMKDLCALAAPEVPVSLVLNSYEAGALRDHWQLSPGEIAELTGLTQLGWIPRDREWQQRILKGEPGQWTSGAAWDAVDRIRRSLEGESVSFGDPADMRTESSEGGLLARLFRR